MKLTSYSGTVFLCVVLVTIVFLYRRYDDKESAKNDDDYDDIQKHLIGSSPNSKLPIIWIPIKYEYNSRHWSSFGSRSSFQLNQPYMYFTVKSVIRECSSTFNICIVDDNSFAKLIPNWSIDLSTISDPILTNVRMLGMMQLLHRYGGIVVPPSFLCTQNLEKMYEGACGKAEAFICESVDTNVTSTNYGFCPDPNFIGAPKGSAIIGELISHIQVLLSQDSTAASVFNGDISTWCTKQISAGKMRLVPGTLVGTKDMEGNAVLVDQLLQNDYIEFYPKMYGIYIPAASILSRTKYEWYARLSTRQVLQTKVILSKYILASTSKKHAVQVPAPKENDWISFWTVPLKAPIWGLKPTLLGGYVPRT